MGNLSDYCKINSRKRNEEPQMLAISPAEFKLLKEKYADAVKENKSEFEFQGKTLVTGYAKYLIEYLTNRMEI